jgi:hypothetical protein
MCRDMKQEMSMGRDLKLSQITTPRGLDKAGYVRDAPILDLAGFQTLAAVPIRYGFPTRWLAI